MISEQKLLFKLLGFLLVGDFVSHIFLPSWLT